MITLPAAPAAGGAFDRDRVYLPLADAVQTAEGIEPIEADSAVVAALDRQTGQTVWTTPIRSGVAPVAASGFVYVAAANEVWALDAATGRKLWYVPLEHAARGPMVVRGPLLVVPTDGGDLVAVRTDVPAIAWRRPVGDSGAVRMTATDTLLYVSTADSRVVAVSLRDGAELWQRTLAGELSEPAVARDRVLVGSTNKSFWALDPESGMAEWVWDGRLFGGDVLGTAVDGDIVYMAALDNIVRAFNRGNGNQRWKREIGTRPIAPPVAFGGIVAVPGLSPTITTFNARTGAPVSTWSAPANAELQGPPLIDPRMRPFRVGIIVILRDARVIGLNSTAMLFKDPAPVTLTAMPGRQLPREPSPAGR